MPIMPVNKPTTIPEWEKTALADKKIDTAEAHQLITTIREDGLDPTEKKYLEVIINNSGRTHQFIEDSRSILTAYLDQENTLNKAILDCLLTTNSPEQNIALGKKLVALLHRLLKVSQTPHIEGLEEDEGLNDPGFDPLIPNVMLAPTLSSEQKISILMILNILYTHKEDKLNCLMSARDGSYLVQQALLKNPAMGQDQALFYQDAWHILNFNFRSTIYLNTINATLEKLHKNKTPRIQLKSPYTSAVTMNVQENYIVYSYNNMDVQFFSFVNTATDKKKVLIIDEKYDQDIDRKIKGQLEIMFSFKLIRHNGKELIQITPIHSKITK